MCTPHPGPPNPSMAYSTPPPHPTPGTAHTKKCAPPPPKRGPIINHSSRTTTNWSITALFCVWCLCVKVCFDRVWALCTVVGYVLRFGEIVHKRVHYYFSPAAYPGVSAGLRQVMNGHQQGCQNILHCHLTQAAEQTHNFIKTSHSSCRTNTQFH